jgi:hypothetical protein
MRSFHVVVVSGVVSLAGLAALPAACGSSSEQGEPTQQATAAQACASQAAAYCAYAERCEPSLLKKEFGDAANCTARLNVACVWATAPGVTVTAAQRQACAASWASRGCREAVDPMTSPCNFESAKGTLADGVACGTDTQCAGGDCYFNTSVPADGGTPSAPVCGQCRTLPGAGKPCLDARCDATSWCDPGSHMCRPHADLAPEAASCGVSDAGTTLCAFGLTCGTSGTCVKAPAEGQPCTEVCAGGMLCVGGTCKPYPKPGEPCTGMCESDSTCEYETKICVANTWVKSGESCSASGKPTGCLGGQCETSGDGGMTCVARIADGQPCGPGTSRICQYSSQCVGDVCTPPTPDRCK